MFKKLFSAHYVIGTVMLLTLLGLHRGNLPAVEWLQNKSFDLYQQIQPRQPDPSKMAAEVAIIDIDEKALAAQGQWPWPRNLLAELVTKLTQAGVAAIGFDIVFAEADRTSPALIAAQNPQMNAYLRKSLQGLPSNEDILVKAISQSRVVLGQVGIAEDKSYAQTSPKAGFGILSSNADKLIYPYLNRYRGLVTNRPELDTATQGLGLFSTRPDADGIIRRVALIETLPNKKLRPALALEMLRVALGGKDDYLIKGFKDGSAGIQSIIVKTANPKQTFEIPTDARGQVYVHFASYATKPPLYLSAADVMSGDPQTLQKLAGKLVIIGTSAAGLKDIRQTPISPVLPGVEVHAQLLETILSNSHLTRPADAVMIEFGGLLIGGLVMIFLIPRLSALSTFLLSTGIIGGLVASAWYYYTTKQQLLDITFPALSITAIFVILSYLNYMHEERERKKAKAAFGHYVSPALLEQIAANPDKLVLGGETRNITILFSDIRGFTTISERFNAQELTRFINKFLTPMTNVIMEQEGTIDKYMGDAIMAFWNAPLDVENHAVKACIAALKMQEAVKALNAKLQADAAAENGTTNRRHYVAPIAIGVGVNTGDCCVGNMGSDQRFDYSALGDDVNLASRLEGQSKTYGVDVVLGQNTVAQLPENLFSIIELDLIQVKGKTEPVTVYALLGEAAGSDATVEHDTAAMLKAYRSQQWSEAERYARRLPQHREDLQTLCDLYLERIANFQKSPPPEHWNGVYIAKSK
jgi:adenylate cyclase